MPPIYIQNAKLRDMIILLIDNKIKKDSFIIKQIDSDMIRLSTMDNETHEECITVLKSKNQKFHTFTPKHAKCKTFVVKGIRGGFDTTDVSTALNELNMRNVKITKTSKLWLINKTQRSTTS